MYVVLLGCYQRRVVPWKQRTTVKYNVESSKTAPFTYILAKLEQTSMCVCVFLILVTSFSQWKHFSFNELITYYDQSINQSINQSIKMLEISLLCSLPLEKSNSTRWLPMERKWSRLLLLFAAKTKTRLLLVFEQHLLHWCFYR